MTVFDLAPNPQKGSAGRRVNDVEIRADRGRTRGARRRRRASGRRSSATGPRTPRPRTARSAATRSSGGRLRPERPEPVRTPNLITAAAAGWTIEERPGGRPSVTAAGSRSARGSVRCSATEAARSGSSAPAAARCRASSRAGTAGARAAARHELREETTPAARGERDEAGGGAAELEGAAAFELDGCSEQGAAPGAGCTDAVQKQTRLHGAMDTGFERVRRGGAEFLVELRAPSARLAGAVEARVEKRAAFGEARCSISYPPPVRSGGQLEGRPRAPPELRQRWVEITARPRPGRWLSTR